MSASSRSRPPSAKRRGYRDERRAEMGRRGRSYVETELSWERVAADVLAAYRWVLGRGERPDAVAL